MNVTSNSLLGQFEFYVMYIVTVYEA